MSANVADLLARQARATPDAPAVIERDRTWRYADFDRAVQGTAAALRKQGIAPGDVVGLTLPSSSLHLALVYALARIGAVLLTLPSREPPAARAALAERFRAVTVLDERSADPAWLAAGADTDAAPPPGGDAPWKIVVTSGTTGRPKAALHTHAMQLERCASNQGALPARADDRFLIVVEMDFDSGLRHCLFCHYAGAAVVLDRAYKNESQFIEVVGRASVTYLSLTAFHLEKLLAEAPGRGLPGVRVVRSGAMRHPPALCAEVRRRISPNLYVMYGTNDGASPLTCLGGDDLERHAGALGFTCPGIEAQATEEGLLRFRGPRFPMGYIDDPQATARYFRDGWYYPGDSGSVAEGGLVTLHGRSDDLINCVGIKIYPSEIESVLLAHPAVAEAAAFPLPSRPHQELPAAAVVLRRVESLEQAQVTSQVLRHARERLGRRAPAKLLLVRALPRNAAGKVDRRELARRLEALEEKLGQGRN